MKLNLGSGTNRIQDHISVDLYIDEADLGLDLTRKLPFDDESIDAIYSSHVVEHFSRAEWDDIRKDWTRVIKKGGTIEIRCPDIVKVCEQMLANPYDPFTMMKLYGLQSTEGEYHKNGFTQESLTDSFPHMVAELLSPSSDYELHMRFTK